MIFKHVSEYVRDKGCVPKLTASAKNL